MVVKVVCSCSSGLPFFNEYSEVRRQKSEVQILDFGLSFWILSSGFWLLVSLKSTFFSLFFVTIKIVWLFRFNLFYFNYFVVFHIYSSGGFPVLGVWDIGPFAVLDLADFFTFRVVIDRVDIPVHRLLIYVASQLTVFVIFAIFDYISIVIHNTVLAGAVFAPFFGEAVFLAGIVVVYLELRFSLWPPSVVSANAFTI